MQKISLKQIAKHTTELPLRTLEQVAEFKQMISDNKTRKAKTKDNKHKTAKQSKRQNRR